MPVAMFMRPSPVFGVVPFATVTKRNIWWLRGNDVGIWCESLTRVRKCSSLVHESTAEGGELWTYVPGVHLKWHWR
jgi:hypothetical protein